MMPPLVKSTQMQAPQKRRFASAHPLKCPVFFKNLIQIKRVNRRKESRGRANLGNESEITSPDLMPYTAKKSYSHPGGMTANSRGLSEAIPPVSDQNTLAPRRSASKR